jgi:hypothetical protein
MYSESGLRRERRMQGSRKCEGRLTCVSRYCMHTSTASCCTCISMHMHPCVRCIHPSIHACVYASMHFDASIHVCVCVYVCVFVCVCGVGGRVQCQWSGDEANDEMRTVMPETSPIRPIACGRYLLPHTPPSTHTPNIHRKTKSQPRTPNPKPPTPTPAKVGDTRLPLLESGLALNRV